MDFPIIKNGTDCTEGLKEYIPVGTAHTSIRRRT